MEECFLDLIFLLGAARPLGFLVGEVLFFQQLKLEFLHKVKAFIFITISVLLQLLLAIDPIRKK